EAEFQRLDKSSQGELNAKQLSQSNLSAAHFTGKEPDLEPQGLSALGWRGAAAPRCGLRFSFLQSVGL
ncbi:MAG: hypothetical protein WBR26_05515, partial [Candidatus Acidiferrum sp.]